MSGWPHRIVGEVSEGQSLGALGSACLSHDIADYPDDPFPVVETEIGRLGAAICYDWLFPETLRELAFKGAEVLVRVSAYMDPWGATPPMDWWTLFNRARAAENTACVVACNQGASLAGYPPFSWPGGSMIVDHDGRIMSQADPGEGEKIVVGPVDVAAVRDAISPPRADMRSRISAGACMVCLRGLGCCRPRSTPSPPNLWRLRLSRRRANCRSTIILMRSLSLFPLVLVVVALTGCGERAPLYLSDDPEIARRNDEGVMLMGRYDYDGAYEAFASLLEDHPQLLDVPDQFGHCPTQPAARW